MKNSNDTIGNRTRDLPNCSAVPQPTALPRAPLLKLATFSYNKAKCLLYEDLTNRFNIEQNSKITCNVPFRCALLSAYWTSSDGWNT